ncbi:unnamed protein product [Malus baccata var. baccata]
MIICIWTYIYLVGLSGALETLCGQGFGAKLYRMGAPLAASISIWISMLMLAKYVKRAKKFERTWEGFSFESFHYVLMDLKLALPFAAMVCLEYWAFEILVFLAGVMPNAKQITSLIAMCVNTEAIAYMITYGLSAAASTRVSNELGAGNPDKAKKAMVVTLKLSVLLAFLVDLALAVGHNLWAGLFSDSRAIIKLFAYMTPFLAISVLADSVQGVLSGWDHLVFPWGLFNLLFYLIRMTIAGVFAHPNTCTHSYQLRLPNSYAEYRKWNKQGANSRLALFI